MLRITKRTSVCLLLTLMFTSLLPAQRYQWAYQLGINNWQVTPGGIATDPTGTSYVGGVFRDNISISGTNLSPLQRWEGFLAKLDANGNTQWVYRPAQLQGPPGHPQLPWSGVSEVQFLSDNTVAGVVNFRDNLLIMGDTLRSDFIYDLAVVNWDTAGNVLDYVHFNAAKTQASLLKQSTNPIRFDPSGSFTASYTIRGTLHTNKGDSLVSDSLNSLIIARFNPSGRLVWTYKFPSFSNFFDVTDVDVDAEGNVYLLAFSRGDSLNFGSQVVPGNQEIFLFKLNTFGNPEWVRQIRTDVQSSGFFGGTAYWQLSATANGETYVTGSVSYPFKIGTTQLGGGITVGSGITNAFIARFDQLGNPIWAKELLATEEVNLLGLHWNDFVSKAFIVGRYSQEVQVDTFLLRDSTGSKSQEYNHYFVQIDTAGTADWVLGGVGGLDSKYIELSSDVQGNLNFQATFLDTTRFGPFNMTTPRSYWFDVLFGRIENQGTQIPAGVSQHHTSHANSNMLGVTTAVDPSLTRDLDWQVFPTLSDGIFKLYHQDIGYPTATVSVITLTGQELRTTALSQREAKGIYQLDLSDQKPGVYFLRLSAGDKTSVRKIILHK